jgi:beta-carotene ketolase (CrtO type)
VSTPRPDHDVIVVGGGHNGLVTAGYLARAGRSVLVLEARSAVGGTATSESFAGAVVNVCNCDHVTLRTTPVIDDLELSRFGLRYLELEPNGAARAWSGGATWTHWHDIDRTVDGLARTHPDEVDGYRSYVRRAVPAVSTILAAAAEPPTLAGLSRLALRRRFRGLSTVFRWSRRSAASVMREHFRTEALLGAGMVGGPMVWGVSPELPGTGLGALAYAMRHVARVGRPVGGSQTLPEALRASVEHHGGTVRTCSTVTAILCTADRVTGVRLADGTEITAPVVVSAADPRRTFVEWLEHPPAGARRLVDRWRTKAAEDGYESKIDAVLTSPPILRGSDHPLSSTLTITPTLVEMDDAYRRLSAGTVIRNPAMLVNVPSLIDESIAPDGRHVLSIEVLLTPYRHPGGWAASTEPSRWLELVAGQFENDLLGSIESHRVMTPDVYERDFNLPRGHATSFGGGPIAALRSREPELTRYETAVPGLYLTGAATFPGAGIWGASGRNCATVVLGRKLTARR